MVCTWYMERGGQGSIAMNVHEVGGALKILSGFLRFELNRNARDCVKRSVRGQRKFWSFPNRPLPWRSDG